MTPSSTSLRMLNSALPIISNLCLTCRIALSKSVLCSSYTFHEHLSSWFGTQFFPYPPPPRPSSKIPSTCQPYPSRPQQTLFSFQLSALGSLLIVKLPNIKFQISIVGNQFNVGIFGLIPLFFIPSSAFFNLKTSWSADEFLKIMC